MFDVLFKILSKKSVFLTRQILQKSKTKKIKIRLIRKSMHPSIVNFSLETKNNISSSTTKQLLVKHVSVDLTTNFVNINACTVMFKSNKALPMEFLHFLVDYTHSKCIENWKSYSRETQIAQKWQIANYFC